jgi:hypothetical protein
MRQAWSGWRKYGLRGGLGGGGQFISVQLAGGPPAGTAGMKMTHWRALAAYEAAAG